MQKISSDYKWETFLSISPITGLGLCELRELCERLILSSVWAVLLHKAGDVFTLRPCASAGKQQVVLDFLRLAGMSFCAAIVRQAQRANRMISHRDAGLFAVGQYWFIDICGGNLLGRVDLPKSKKPLQPAGPIHPHLSDNLDDVVAADRAMMPRLQMSQKT